MVDYGFRRRRKGGVVVVCFSCRVPPKDLEYRPSAFQFECESGCGQTRSGEPSMEGWEVKCRSEDRGVEVWERRRLKERVRPSVEQYWTNEQRMSASTCVGASDEEHSRRDRRPDGGLVVDAVAAW